jgi:DNA-3-methyladenine glycosylase I
MSYCDSAPGHPFHGPYHDAEYGFPSREEGVLFERLVLEINQAGLSWLTVLKKREAFRAAYAGWDVDCVAGFRDEEVARLLADPGIIRNRLKIDAAIRNARTIQEIRGEHGSFADWIDAHHPRPKEEWVKLFKRHFAFMGGEIVGEFLMSLGYLPGAHRADCPVMGRLALLGPPWMQAKEKARP